MISKRSADLIKQCADANVKYGGDDGPNTMDTVDAAVAADRELEAHVAKLEARIKRLQKQNRTLKAFIESLHN